MALKLFLQGLILSLCGVCSAQNQNLPLGVYSEFLTGCSLFQSNHDKISDWNFDMAPLIGTKFGLYHTKKTFTHSIGSGLLIGNIYNRLDYYYYFADTRKTYLTIPIQFELEKSFSKKTSLFFFGAFSFRWMIDYNIDKTAKTISTKTSGTTPESDFENMKGSLMTNLHFGLGIAYFLSDTWQLRWGGESMFVVSGQLKGWNHTEIGDNRIGFFCSIRYLCKP